jgi:glyoxylase-like metal-dependent hydrolase (beta-lactamase superfamily II)
MPARSTPPSEPATAVAVALAAAGAVELAPGLWRWVAYYPDWKADVGCLAYAAAGALVLVDPLAPPERAAARRFWRALDGAVEAVAAPVQVVVTVRWHERHAAAVAERYGGSAGAEIWAPAGAVRHLSRPPDHAFRGGEPLPAGIESFATLRDDEVVIWLPRARALVSGDVLLGGKRRPLRVCPQSWLPRGVGRPELAASLAPLLALPVELVVPAHGDPVRTGAQAVLEQALADAA